MRKNGQNIFILTMVMLICCILGCSIGFSYAYFIDRSRHDGAGNVATLDIHQINPATGNEPTLANLKSPPITRGSQTFSNGENQLVSLTTTGNSISGYVKAVVYVEWYEDTGHTKDPNDGGMYIDGTKTPTVIFNFAQTTSNASVEGHWRRLSTSKSIFDAYYFCVYDSEETVSPGHTRDELVSVPANTTINFLTSVTTVSTLPASYTDGNHYYVITISANIEQIP